MKTRVRPAVVSSLPLLLLAGVAGCGKPQTKSAVPHMQALPVQTVTIAAQPVPQSDQYVATIESRHSAVINPQVNGNITRILVRSGDHVRAGKLLIQIDPSKQEATVASQKATDAQLEAVLNYDREQYGRQRALYSDGVVSKDAMQQAQQAYASAKANYQAGLAVLKTQEEQLAYYRVTAPFSGIVGDIPVHIGDYVTSSTQLTTLDATSGLEAYIYVPTDRSGELRNGLHVNILDNTGKLIEKTAIDFVSPQVDNALQGILVKAPVHSANLRNEQIVKAQVIWGMAPYPIVPVLAVSRLGGQAFVFLAKPAGAGKYVAHEQPVTLGTTVGNFYAVTNGLSGGEQLIVSGTQMLMDGMPVIPMHAGPPQKGAAPHPGME